MRTLDEYSVFFCQVRLQPIHKWFKFVELNDWVYFTGFHPQYGVELFKVEFTKLDQEIVLDAIPDKTFGDPPFQIVASATSGLPITITSGDELIITGTNAAIVKPGTVKIVVSQEGDALFNAAEPVAHTFCIVPAKPTITVSGLNTGEPVLTSSANDGNQWFHNDMEIGNATEKTFVVDESCTFKVNVTLFLPKTRVLLAILKVFFCLDQFKGLLF